MSNMINRRQINFMLFVALLLGISFSINKTIRVSANPISVIEEVSGGLFPNNGTDLQMIEANVLLDIDETYGSAGVFFISFDGNYTIYNQNSTVNVSIAAPFFSIFEGLDETLAIEVEGMIVDYYIEYYWDNNISESIWSEYVSISMFGRYFAICNLTFNGFSNTTIRYSFESIARIGSFDSIMILYDVGSARAWSDVTTETVEFRVHGLQPSYYTDGTYMTDVNIKVADITDGMNYIWSWDEVVIEDYWVSIHYYKGDFNTTVPGFTIITSLITFVTILYIVRRRLRI